MSKARQGGENPESPDQLQALIESVARSGPSASDRWLEIWQAMLADPWLPAETALRAQRLVKACRLEEHVSEDIAQEVLLLLAAKLAADEVMHAQVERFPESFSGWIGTILNHACSEAARILKEYRHHAELHDVKTIEDRVSELDRRWDCATVASRLEGRQRSVVMLFLQGQERREIAQSLGLSYSQVVYTLKQARPLLQRWLAAYGKEASARRSSIPER